MRARIPFQPTWEVYSGSYYWFSEGMLAWINSRRQCMKHNSDLAIINDKKELEFLYNKTERGDYSIGLTLENGMRWLWNDGTELERTLFTMKSAEMEEECAAIHAREVIPVICNQKRHWICEKKVK
ncbi:hypothetical protein lerEdw1_009036 [Lerista edwardsae]|nr:hypothetical protein lerEdw1_009036 [Lerista edwardsae]